MLAALAVSANNISAHTEHTYMNLRSTNVNLPMELTTFYERTQLKLEHRFGGNLQISGFYGESNGNFGSYFGINGDSTYRLKGDPIANTKSTEKDDFDLGYILHGSLGGDEGAIATVSLDPSSKSYGARFDYYQNMDKLLKGLYLKVNTTVVRVENDMELNVEGIQGSEGGYTPEDYETWLTEFFTGHYFQTTNGEFPNDAQVALDYGLIKDEHSATGFADVDVILGYKFLYKDKYHFGINLAITIPTGNKPNGREMFEPIYGNGSHFGFGGGLDAHANLWTKGKQNIKLNFAANYRYLFESSEHRPLKLKGYASPYVLLGKDGHVDLIPAVNILTPLGVNVTPGSQFDGILALAYNNGGFSADLGYNMYYREDEDLSLKHSLPHDTFGVAARDWLTADEYDYETPIEFDVTGIDRNPSSPLLEGNWLTNDSIDIEKAETPSQFTNGIYGGLGYHFKKWKDPLLLGVGGKYDWANENSIPNYWMVWGKLSLSF